MPNDSRRDLVRQIGQARESNVIVYATSDRPNMEAQIDNDAFDHFVRHLDHTWDNDRSKISLILHTAGGNTAAAWRIINLLRIFCDDLEVIIPNKAHSAGTLISLGTDRIVMTKQATLGPIDPSLTGPLSPQVPGAPHQRVPVSVEAVQGYIDLARNQLALTDSGQLAGVLTSLSSHVHPLVLGQIFRSRNQIRSLAEDLLAQHGVTDSETKGKIVDFLCSESGSHDRTINRREAERLGLVVEKPSAAEYDLINGLYETLVADMEMASRFDAMIALAGQSQATFQCQRAVVESEHAGSTKLWTRGDVALVQHSQPGPTGMSIPVSATEVRVTFEGWEHEEWTT